MSINEESWLRNYEALKAHVIETGHFPNKHDRRLNWYKYNVKLIKQGKLSEDRERMIHELENMRSGEHTGGRRKKEPNLNPLINEEISTNS
jgi:hypothetical protein